LPLIVIASLIGIITSSYAPVYHSCETWLLLIISALLMTKLLPIRHLGLILLFFNVSYFLNQQTISWNEKRINFYSNATINVIAKVIDINKNDQTSLSSLTLQIQRLKTDATRWHHVNDTIILYTRGNDYLAVGDIIYIKELKCSAIKDERQKNFLVRNQYRATSFCTSKIKRIKRPHMDFYRFIHRTKHTIRNSLKKKLPSENFNLLSSIFLGKRDTTNFHFIKKPFMTWGITHYLARSGLHLAVIFIAIATLLNCLFIPIILKTFIIFLMCTLYALFSWSSISFTRSFLLISGYQLCTLLKIPINSFHLLNIVLLSCIYFNTQLIFSLDFQLTFLLTYSLILINKYKHLNPGQSKFLRKKQPIS